MRWCPLTKEDCREHCAWFSQEECALIKLHDVVDKLEDVSNSLDKVERAITTLHSFY